MSDRRPAADERSAAGAGRPPVDRLGQPVQAEGRPEAVAVVPERPAGGPGLLARLEEGRAAAVLAGLLALLALAMLAWRGGTVAFPDEAEYLALARSLLASGTFGPEGGAPSAYRLPLYPAFLAAILALRDDPALVQAVQLALWLATGLLLGAVARERGGPLAGLLATALWGAYPHALFLATTLYPQALLAPLLALSLRTALGAPSLVRAATTGLLGGLSILAVAHAAPAAAIHLAVAAGRLPRPRSLAALAAGALLLALPPALWTVHNAVRLGAPVLTTNGGINLLLGNAPGVTPETGTGLDLAPYAEATRGLSELEADRVFRRLALEWIRDHPGEAAHLYLAKLGHWLVASDRLATAGEESRARALLAALGWYGLLLLLVLGTILAARAGGLDRRLLLASWGAWTATALLYAVFFTRVRFRIPFDGLLVPPAALGLAGVLAPRVFAALNRRCGSRGRAGG